MPVPVSKSPSPFTRAELEASVPFVPGYRLDGEVGQRLLDRVLDAFAAVEARDRSRKKADQERLERTASALLANLLVARRNHHNAMIFVGVSFETGRYSGGDLSVEALRKLREFLWADGLVEGQRGYYSQTRWDSESTVHRHSRTTRMRATERVICWIKEAGTFGRLLNGKTVVNASRWSRPTKAPEDLSLADFRRFAQALIEMHRPIAEVFGTGASLRLQHLDSEILLKVLARMNDLGVVALPVHDSVIVAKSWAEDLHQAMRAAYHEVMGHEDIQINQA